MHKTGLLAVAAALGVALVGGWLIVATHARSTAGKDARIEPFPMMKNANGLPTQAIVDYSVGH